MVVDATELDEVSHRATRLELTITTGPHKGEVVSVRATDLARDPLDLLAMPATLTVRDGRPTVSFD